MDTAKLLKSTRFARILKLDDDTVVKSIQKDYSIAPHDPYQELSILQKLNRQEPNNDNIIRLISSEITDEDINLVFPFYKMSLQDFLQQSCQKTSNNPYYSIGEDTIVKYRYRFDTNKYCYDFFNQLVVGLDFIHSQKIIHRDMKPQNVMLDFIDEDKIILKIIDFGIAYDFKDNQKEDKDNLITDVSTSIYKAPELLFGVKNYSYSVDIWSLFIMLTQWLQKDRLSFTNIEYIPAIVDNGASNDEVHLDAGSDIKLIFSIFEKFGVPSKEQWSQVIEFGSSDAFIGMFSGYDTSTYFYNKTKEEQKSLLLEWLPGLLTIENPQHTEKLIECCLGMVHYQSTLRISTEQLLKILN
ncbi:hypothetical protein Kpol_1035p34 [Vanderwaltozyma polyspora DSM 70294]|uniref:Protein kinase domain-containing protein n=1 Tax=Vanderwaltozyma polyspora (strain ATCC 22028 / DSM 70294 / BCRC 21397 / CBS 2163 / NBRC 10782 / NRRL Y-8283 / UCD 57-17) TaxID=436907 RepID=A7TKJ9_VANPO|nr:uncharacterized protein Kpol_1035p34 [Vanderwaltozyma polyspora DSM 70294]EDO17221.1 hypothetical protein Kpol_1035p34 [Vanderwaltozyma polyspora DSM 70294]